jgi:hypothetical protein
MMGKVSTEDVVRPVVSLYRHDDEQLELSTLVGKFRSSDWGMMSHTTPDNDRQTDRHVPIQQNCVL